MSEATKIRIAADIAEAAENLWKSAKTFRQHGMESEAKLCEAAATIVPTQLIVGGTLALGIG